MRVDETDIWPSVAVVQTTVRHSFTMMVRYMYKPLKLLNKLEGMCFVREKKTHSVTIITALNSSSTERMVV